LKSLSSLLARGVLAASLAVAAPQLFAAEAAQNADTNSSAQVAEAKPCHWWNFGKCVDPNAVEGLPSDAPHDGTLITVDVARNKIYLFQNGELVDKAPAATGSEKVLKKAGKTFVFHTPRGRMKVLRKIEDPVWTKPDWAFIEDGQPVPPPDSPARKVKGHLGKFALDLGDGIMIHGTDDVGSFGRRASHGCIRVPGDMLETVYNAAKIGTPVYIFESESTQTATNNVKTGERHSDLDF
jgi:lipoprotein-anchoring transpeptidase ErfK/SrfK